MDLKVNGVGNLSKDPELKYTAAGVPVASFSIAVNSAFKDKATGQYPVHFFNVTCWRTTAEFVAKYLKKGNKVQISGSLQTRSWVDQATGMKRTATDIVADEVQNLSPKNADVEDDVPTTEEVPEVTDTQAEEPDPFLDQA